MKQILAIIRIAKMNETKIALSEVGLPSFTAISVMGRGKGRGIGPTIQETLSDPEKRILLNAPGEMPRLKSKRAIQLVVTDDKKDLAIQTIITVNQTNNSGDGKIFVLDELDSVRVRTSEKGDITLD